MMTHMGKENNVKVYWASTTHNRMVCYKVFSTKYGKFLVIFQNFGQESLKLTLECYVGNFSQETSTISFL